MEESFGYCRKFPLNTIQMAGLKTTLLLLFLGIWSISFGQFTFDSEGRENSQIILDSFKINPDSSQTDSMKSSGGIELDGIFRAIVGISTETNHSQFLRIGGVGSMQIGSWYATGMGIETRLRNSADSETLLYWHHQVTNKEWATAPFVGFDIGLPLSNSGAVFGDFMLIELGLQVNWESGRNMLVSLSFDRDKTKIKSNIRGYSSYKDADVQSLALNISLGLN